MSADPQFVDLGRYDLRLRPTSPCIGAGEGGKSIGAPPRIRAFVIEEFDACWFEWDEQTYVEVWVVVANTGPETLSDVHVRFEVGDASEVVSLGTLGPNARAFAQTELDAELPVTVTIVVYDGQPVERCLSERSTQTMVIHRTAWQACP